MLDNPRSEDDLPERGSDNVSHNNTGPDNTGQNITDGNKSPKGNASNKLPKNDPSPTSDTFPTESLNNSLESPITETADFIDIGELTENQELRESLLKIALNGAIHHSFADSAGITYQDLEQFQWNGGVLGVLNLKREDAVIKGERWLPYKQMEEFHFATSTFAVPRQNPARVAYIIAEELDQARKRGDIQRTQEIISRVSRKAFEKLCENYGVQLKDTEVLFDDNASTALYQYLGHLYGKRSECVLKAGNGILTFFDTGRVIPMTIMGNNPESQKFNFKPAIDIFNNGQYAESVATLGDNLFPHLVSHYNNGRYISDREILKNITDKMGGITNEPLPRIFIIPTVTRLGRRLPFVEMSIAIREHAKTLNDLADMKHVPRPYEHPPVIILDDCQGLGRIRDKRYLTGRDESGIQESEIQSVWDYADGIMLTGAKVLGALMGSGAMLMKKSHFEKHMVPFEDSVVQARARKFAFYSMDASRVHEYNLRSTGVAQTPEIASLSVALEELPNLDHFNLRIDSRLKELRKHILLGLKEIPHMHILEPEVAEDVQFISSIISFHITTNEGVDLGEQLKQNLSIPHSMRSGVGGAIHPEYDEKPIIIPSKVEEQQSALLRLSFDPHKVSTLDGYKDYAHKLQYLLARMEREVQALSESREEKNN